LKKRGDKSSKGQGGEKGYLTNKTSSRKAPQITDNELKVKKESNGKERDRKKLPRKSR